VDLNHFARQQAIQ